MTEHVSSKVEKGLKRRYRKERLFRLFSFMSVMFGFAVVVVLLLDISLKALPAFSQHWLKLDVEYRQQWLAVESNDLDALEQANYREVVKQSLFMMLPEAKTMVERKLMIKMLSLDAEFRARNHLLENPEQFGQSLSLWVLLDDDIDSYLKQVDEIGEPWGRTKEQQAAWLKLLSGQGRIEKRFNIGFFTNTDSREPEIAGIKGAVSGTLLTMLVTLMLSFPIGVAAALYLEEFAQRNRLTDLIEININNLAAVPSIVFGLFGLAVIINVFGLPRSAPLVAGIVLALMTLPTIIIASRAAIKAVPNTLRDAALGLGASRMQVTFGLVLPQAMPGIITGTIIGMVQAIGETAPLLMIGMVAFIVESPQGVFDAATVLPVQIFLWADSPEPAFLARTSAAILVLLAILVFMNFCASMLRKYYENKSD